MTRATLEILERLIAFETVSRESNLALIDFVEAQLRALGAETRRTWNDQGDKANLLARFGPAVEGGVVLSGHSDVVPVEGQPWSHPPFSLIRRDGRLFGRGTADMKGFLASVMAAAPAFATARLSRPIFLAFTYDEEVGCFGAIRLVEDLVATEPRPRAVIVGEPTSMRLVTACKGIRSFHTTVTGREAHSSQPETAANAVLEAARLVLFLDGLAAEYRERPDPSTGFDPPYTSFNVGVIGGGTAMNIVPRECRFSWEYRSLPADDSYAAFERFQHHVDEVALPRLRAQAPEATIETVFGSEVPGCRPEGADSPAEALVRRLTGSNDTFAVEYATEAGRYQAAGLSTVIFGPGSIDQAHKPDEFIEIEQLALCDAFLRKLLRWAESPD